MAQTKLQCRAASAPCTTCRTRVALECRRESLIDALESMNKVDHDGFMINRSKNSHLGHRYVELTCRTGGDFKGWTLPALTA
jgi:hypothetical protein